jgi:fatty acid desaturase
MGVTLGLGGNGDVVMSSRPGRVTGPVLAPTSAAVDGALIIAFPNCPRTPTERPIMATAFEDRSPSLSNREDFAELSRRVREDGLLGRRTGYYAVKIALSVAALGAVAVFVVLVGNSWWVLAAAVALAFVLTQLGFIGHDAGHRQICTRRRHNDLIGLVVANLFAGFSFGWWLNKHNRHHAHTQRLDKDPDLVPGALVYTPDQARARGWVGREFARTQVLMLVPLLFLEALNLHVASAISLSRRRDRGVLVESGLLVLHVMLFFVAPFFLLSPLRAVGFILVTQALFGFYLGVSFITNHVGMPTLVGTDELGFLRRQVLTSRNLSGPSFSGFMFGGLDTQIEHHLFPSMPRANLRRARTLVRPFCDERRIHYAEQSPWRAWREVLVHLRCAGTGRPISVID